MQIILVSLCIVIITFAKAPVSEKCSKCGPNMVDTSKDNCLCEYELSCDAPIPGGCPDNCAKRKCSCKKGFYRTRDNTKCVAWKDCPDSPLNKKEGRYGPCASTDCFMATCEDKELDCGNPPCPLQPTCIPIKRSFEDCSLYQCRRCDEYCMMINEPACFHGNCTMHPECIPKNVDSCANYNNCEDGTVCRMIPVQCFTCPCYPKPECVKF